MQSRDDKNHLSFVTVHDKPFLCTLTGLTKNQWGPGLMFTQSSAGPFYFVIELDNSHFSAYLYKG